MTDVQKKELEMLKALKKILEEYGLTYFIAYGSCIGVVRHSGFIPWDDDIDIAMPREDYEKFREKYYKFLPDNYELIEPNNNEAFPYLWMKVHDKSTTYIEEEWISYPELYMGVFIDIFPIDGLPKNEQDRIKHIKKFHNLRRINSFLRKKKKDSLPMHLFKETIKKALGYSFFSKRATALVKKYSFNSSDKVALMTYGAPGRFDKAVFNRVDFDNTIEKYFEGELVKIPCGFHDYLTQFYGDYNKIPSKKEQLAAQHTPAICDMNISYKYYQQKALKKREKNA